MMSLHSSQMKPFLKSEVDLHACWCDDERKGFSYFALKIIGNTRLAVTISSKGEVTQSILNVQDLQGALL